MSPSTSAFRRRALLAIAGGVTLEDRGGLRNGSAIRLPTRAESTTAGATVSPSAAPGARRRVHRRGSAVTVLLIVGALLFPRTLKNFSSVDIGFDPQALVLFEVNLVRKVSQLDTSARSSARKRSRSANARAARGLPASRRRRVMENAAVHRLVLEHRGAGRRLARAVQTQAFDPRKFRHDADAG